MKRLKNWELLMSLHEIKTNPETTLFLLSDISDVQLTVSRINNPLFIREASTVDRSLIGTIVSELATNIIKYAGRGSIKIAQTKSEGALDIEIWAEDKGPGIDNISLAMRDFYTTGNSLGLGLPGVKRMADEFAIESESENGTKIYARKRILGNKNEVVINHNTISSIAKKISQEKFPLFDVGFKNQPMVGEFFSGDSVSIIKFDNYFLMAIIDVSGHGYKAHDLSNTISKYLENNICKDLAILMTAFHKLLVQTLGAAIGLLLIDTKLQIFHYLGIGNTGACRCIGDPWRGKQIDGIVGQRLPTLHPEIGYLKRGDIFILYSDGISGHAGCNLVKKHQHDFAQKIAEDFVLELGKQNDDASCIIFKWLV